MNLSPLPIQKFFDNNGNPLTGGLLFTYVAGTTTKVATSSDQAGTPNTNPVVLNYRGEANVWLDQTLTYKFVLSPEGDTDPPTRPIWTVDNISAGVTYSSLTASILGQILWPRSVTETSSSVTPTAYNYPYGDPRRSSFYTNQNWLSFGDVATFISASSFSIPTDVTARYPVQRYLQIRDTSGGASIGRITAAVFGAVTTFTMSMEVGAVPNPITGVFLAMGMMTDYPLGMSYDINSIPTGPIFWNKSNGTGAVSRAIIAGGTSGTGSDVGVAIIAIQNNYAAFPYISGAPSGRQIVIHTGVSAPISLGVFDVCKQTWTVGNNPTHIYTDFNVVNNQSGATGTIASIDSIGGTARVSLRVSGAEKGFLSATNAPEILLGTNSTIDVSIVYNGARVITFNGATTTGASTPTLGTNKPGVNSSIAEWLPVKNAAGTQRYIPMWS